MLNYRASFFMKNFLITFFLFSILYLLLPVIANAQTVCQPIYGGGQSCVSTGNLFIDKKVLNPQINVFVDNLGVNDPKFQPSSTVAFRLAITNTGTANIANVTVRDIFPQFVDFTAGAGSFDSNSKTLTFQIDNIAPSETKTFNLSGKTASFDKLPGVVCVINQSIASSGNISTQDNAQLCIEKVVPTVQIPGATKGGLKVFPAPATKGGTPPTGPEALYLLAFLPTGALGYFLRKKSILA